MRILHILLFTTVGAIFGAIFGAIASIFQGGPQLIQGIQESWWWFAGAGFLFSTIGQGRSRMNGSRNAQ